MSLWDDEDDNTITENDVNLAAIGDPVDLVSMDDKYQLIADKGVKQVGNVLEIVSCLNEAVWELANFTPSSSNTSAFEFWAKNLKPSMINAMTQDIQATNAIFKSLVAIRNFGLVVETAGTNVVKLRGSAAAIAIAKDLIPKELDNLNTMISKLENLELESVAFFQANATKLLEIAGPSAADFSKQEEEVTIVLTKNYEELQKISETSSKLKCEVEKYNNLMYCTKNHSNEAQSEFSLAKSRTNEIKSLVSQAEGQLNAIPDKIEEKTTHSGSSGWWWWRRSYSYTTTRMVKNPNKDAQRNYYDSIIRARESRLKGQMADSEAKLKAKQQLDRDYANYSAQYQLALQRFKDHTTNSKDRISELHQSNAECHKKLETIRKECNSLESNMGLRGSALLDCLAVVRQLGKTQQNAVKIFQPLISIIEGITKISEANVKMLQSGEEAAVYLGGKNLLAKSPHFVETYSVLQDTMEEKTIAFQKQKLLSK